MAEKNTTRIIIWILIGSCVLNLIFAYNAGKKRRVAVSRVDNLDAKLTELQLRYKNAVQSYDAINKDLNEAKKDLKDQQLFIDTLKGSLKDEQKKSLALKEELDKTKALLKPYVTAAVNKTETEKPKKPPVVNTVPKKTNIKW